MVKMKTESIWGPPPKRFYDFLKYTDKYNLDKNILIIGCSDGRYVFPSVMKGFSVCAIDIDYEAIYGGKPVFLDNKFKDYLGLKKRMELENVDSDRIIYKVCDFMDYEPKKKFSLIFTSGSIHYQENNKHDIDKMIEKMINMLDDNGVLLLEYIHKDNETDNTRYFLTKKELNDYVLKHNNVKIISHKVKKYIEESNPRNNKRHEISWGRLYIQKILCL